MEIKNPIMIVGCGPGAPAYITLMAWRIAEKAQVLVGAPHLLALFPENGGERIAVTADIEGLLDQIEARRETASVAVLVTGDPGLCSLARPVLRRFGRENCRVIPGVSALQAAFAGIGEDWIDARIIDAHGRDPEIDPASLRNEKKIAVFAGRAGALAWARALAENLGEHWRLYLCEDLTLPEEKIRAVSPDQLTNGTVSSRAIVVLIKEDQA